MRASVVIFRTLVKERCRSAADNLPKSKADPAGSNRQSLECEAGPGKEADMLVGALPERLEPRGYPVFVSITRLGFGFDKIWLRFSPCS